MHQIRVKGRKAVGIQGVGAASDAVALAFGDRYAVSPADPGHLRCNIQIHLHRGRGLADDADRQPRERRHPPCAVMKRYFSHRAARICDDNSTGTPVAAKASRMACTRGVTRPSSSPMTTRPGPPVWVITPGDAIAAKI